MRAALLILLALTASYGAEPMPWPKALKEKIEFTVTKPSKLPAGLKFDQITVEGLEPHDRRVSSFLCEQVAVHVNRPLTIHNVLPINKGRQ